MFAAGDNAGNSGAGADVIAGRGGTV